jgi:hypothetical protein
MFARRDSGMPPSIGTPSDSSRATTIDRISKECASGSASTMKSGSLLGYSSPRAADPNTATAGP